VSFASLDPSERVALIDGYATGVPALPGAPALSEATLGWLRAAKLALVDDALDEEERDAVREGWLDHVDSLPELEREEAIDRLTVFLELLGGVWSVEEAEEAEP
jgi:hypothetical protein